MLCLILGGQEAVRQAGALHIGHRPGGIKASDAKIKIDGIKHVASDHDHHYGNERKSEP